MRPRCGRLLRSTLGAPPRAATPSPELPIHIPPQALDGLGRTFDHNSDAVLVMVLFEYDKVLSIPRKGGKVLPGEVEGAPQVGRMQPLADKSSDDLSCIRIERAKPDAPGQPIDGLGRADRCWLGPTCSKGRDRARSPAWSRRAFPRSSRGVALDGGPAASRTTIRRDAPSASSSVALNEPTKLCGRFCMNPTVSTASVRGWKPLRSLAVVSRVAKSWSSTKMFAPVSLRTQVDLPALVYPTNATRGGPSLDLGLPRATNSSRRRSSSASFFRSRCFVSSTLEWPRPPRPPPPSLSPSDSSSRTRGSSVLRRAIPTSTRASGEVARASKVWRTTSSLSQTSEPLEP
jgi:hypothetical protein